MKSALAALATLAAPGALLAQSGSLQARALEQGPTVMPAYDVDPAADLYALSATAIRPPEPATYQKHDLVQIIVRETSNVSSSQELTTEKETTQEAEITDFPQITLNDLLDGILKSTSDAHRPKLGVESKREFDGSGEYDRRDDMTARLMAEVIEVLPNGNLVLEARSTIETDGESSVILVSGVCDARDVTAARTIMSNQLFNLQVIKNHQGELRNSAKKGFITKAFDTIFAF